MDPVVDVSTIEIEQSPSDLTRRVSSSLGLSNSPSNILHSASWKKSTGLSRVNTGASTKHLKPFNTEDINILLLENVNKTGRDLLEAQGYQVTCLKTSLSEDELIEKIRCGSALSL